MVFEYKVIPSRDGLINSTHKVRGFSEKRKAVTRRLARNRRKKKMDRRSSVREGVIVSLSFEDNMRRGVERRRL